MAEEIGSKPIDVQTLENIDSFDDLPDVTELTEAQLYAIRSGDLSSDYIAPFEWDGASYEKWRSVIDGINIDIPDTVVSREDDDDTRERSDKYGLVIETKTDWSSIGSTISNLTDGVTRAYLHEYDDENDAIGDLIEDVDVSSKSSGDSFTFDDVNLTSDETYMILLDAEGSDYTLGFFDGSNFPYTSEDLDIIDRWDGVGEETDGTDPSAVNNIGNTRFD